jgi:hypothetical protein
MWQATRTHDEEIAGINVKLHNTAQQLMWHKSQAGTLKVG